MLSFSEMAVSSSSFPSLCPILPLSSMNCRRLQKFKYRKFSLRIVASSTDPLASIGRLLWGRALPPQQLVAVVRLAWSSTWQLMMGQLAPSSDSGSYSRPTSAFPVVPDSYYRTFSTGDNCRLHLYVALPCPWAHRTLIVRALKNLEDDISVSVAAPGDDGSWEFRDDSDTAAGASFLAPSSDKANGRRTLREVYGLRSGGYNGRSTVPMLWSMDKGDVVCNESYGIIEFFNSGFLDGVGMDLAPPDLRGQIEAWNEIIYPNVNNGVYRCGFAQSQEAYNAAVNDLFQTLDMLDTHLATSRYLCGTVLTLADVCLFTTLIRFDLAYNILFKCTKRKLVEFSNLHAYTRDIYQIPKVAETCKFEAIMDGYYKTLFPLNPGSIRPVIPVNCEPEYLNKPHGREILSR